MKPFCIILSALVALPSALVSQSGIESDPMNWPLDRLMADYHSDARYGAPELSARVDLALVERKDLLPQLWSRLEETYFDLPDRDTNPNVRAETLGVLSRRSDLTPAQVHRIADELQRFVGVPEDQWRSAKFFMNAALNLLRHYPSPEHEELVMKFLDRGPDEEFTLRSAASTLAEIGGPRSAAAIRAMIARLRMENPNYRVIRYVRQDLERLDARLATGAAPSSPGKTPPDAASATDATGRLASGTRATELNLWLWVVIALFFASMVFAVVNRRSRR